MIFVEFPVPGPCFGLVVHRGRVHRAPPVARWTVGRSALWVYLYYARRGCTVGWGSES